MEIKGRNLIEGVPKTITIEDSEIREALSECVATIINAIRVALERTPPEPRPTSRTAASSSPAAARAIKNLDKRIREETGLPVSIADDPLASVVLGTGRLLSDFKLLRKISDRLGVHTPSKASRSSPVGRHEVSLRPSGAPREAQ